MWFAQGYNKCFLPADGEADVFLVKTSDKDVGVKKLLGQFSGGFRVSVRL
jgi:hypothetical protein